MFCSGCGKRIRVRYDRKICEARDLDAANYRIYIMKDGVFTVLGAKVCVWKN